MDTQTHARPEGTLSGTSRLPLDVRIVARLLYITGGLGVFAAVLLWSGIAESWEFYPVFSGTLVPTTRLTQGAYFFLVGLWYLFLDWGLRRGRKSVWWLLLALSVYGLTAGVLWSRRHPTPYFAIAVVLQILFVAWLWFRRELYGVRLVAGRRKR